MSLKMKYFVLSPGSKDRTHAEASRVAIAHYALEISEVNPELAQDLQDWVIQLEIEDREPK